MEVDPFEQKVDDNSSTIQPPDADDEEDDDIIHTCETSTVWIAMRDQLVEEIFTSWKASRQ